MKRETMIDEEPLFDDVGDQPSTALKRVRTGMRVVDVAGNEIGTVDDVKLGNPEAATTRGSGSAPTDPVTAFAASVFGFEADVPEPKRSQLLRYGYVKIDGAGLGDSDRYVRGDRVRDVSDDTVILSVGKDRLIGEH